MDIEREKLVRRQQKAAVTRIRNKLTRLIAEEDEPNVRQYNEKLKESFDKFEEAHERYHSLLENEDDIDERLCNFFEYF